MPTLFAAIKPPHHIRSLAQSLQKNVDGVRWAPVDNLHITLGYFGLISDEHAEVLDFELARAPGTGFDVRLKGVGVFGRSRPHTLWLGVEPSPELTALHKACKSAARRAKVEMEDRKFTPHLSLAYMRDGVSLADLSRYTRRYDSFLSKPFLVDQFALFSSNISKTGPNRYDKEANYPLLG